jgi:IclR family acetate operon transcriptional repressor
MAGSGIGLLFLAFVPALRKRMFEAHADLIGSGIESEIDAIAERGYSLDHENWMPGRNCGAIPWSYEGEVRAGFGLAGPSTRLTATKLNEMAKLMLQVTSDRDVLCGR